MGASVAVLTSSLIGLTVDRTFERIRPPHVRRGAAMCEALPMSSIQVADQTFLAVPGDRIHDAVSPRERWRRWWPDLRLTVTQDRGEQGIRWAVEGALTGTMEIWLEPVPVVDGVIVHYFLHAEPSVTGAGLDLAAENRRRRVAGKAVTFELKRELEAGRPAGERPEHARD